MRVLVTGGAGYIGCLVVEELIRRQHAVTVLDTFYWGRDPVTPLGPQVALIQGDCRHSRDVLDALEGIDSVIHLAGIVGEPACAGYPKAHHTTNIESTRTLVHCCTDPELNPVRDMIYASSCSVYGNVQGLYEQVTEETPPAPLSAYAHAKLRSEEILLQRATEVPHFHPTILRLTTVFGWSYRPRLDLVTNQFAFNAWKTGKVTIFGDGSQYRSLIHVADVARALVDALEAPRFIRSGKIFHVGEQANNRTVRQIAETVRSLLPGTEITYRPDRPTDRRDYQINCRRFQNTVGWKARHSVEEGIGELLEKFKSLDWDWEANRFRNSPFDYR
jgi:nucleoside-diphosphate-sugar epimerase